MMKKLHLLCLAIGILAAASVFFPPKSAGAASGETPKTVEEKLAALNNLPPAQREAKLEAEAAREGRVIMYGAYSLGEAGPVFRTFMKRYPKVKVAYYRASTAPLLDKILSEAGVGRLSADVANIGLEVLYEIDDLIVPYKSPNAGDFRPDFVDPHSRWIALYHDPKPIAYNTKRIAREDAPKDWEDLASPRWKGRLGMPVSDGPDWVNITLNFMGQEKGMDYLKRMAAQGVRMEKSNSGLAQLVAAGDIDVALYVNNAAVEIVKGKGGPIVAVPPEPLVTAIQTLVVFKNAAHPYSAALFMDWLTSREGQETIRNTNPRFSGRKDVSYPPAFRSRKFLVIQAGKVKKEKMVEADKIFEDWFVKRKY